MKALPSVLAFAAIAAAQNPITIRGSVVDRDTHAPIPGAEVSLRSPLGGGSAILADGAGRFEFQIQPGAPLAIAASAPGYGTVSRGITPGQSSIQIDLGRVVGVMGRLIDDETGKPLRALRMEAMNRGSLEPVNGAERVTTSLQDGSFLFDSLLPGEYFLRISSTPAPALQTIPAKDLAGENRAKALHPPEGALAYGILVWPGTTADIPQTSGLALTGGVTDVGNIRLARSKLRNIAGELLSCDQGASIQVLLVRQGGSATTRLVTLDTQCGAGFRISNLPEGAFTLAAIQGGPPRRFASLTLDPTARGPVALNMAQMVSVQMIVGLNGADGQDLPQDLKNVRLEIQPESAPVRVDAPDKLPSGEFEAHVFPGERYLLAAKLPPNYYVKEFSYDGVSSENVTSFTASAAPLSTLRLTLSNKAGILEARVSDSSQIYIIREGMAFAEAQFLLKAAPRDGKATFGNLRPGKYFVFTTRGAPPDSQSSLDDYLRHSVSVTVEAGQTASVTPP
jgi:hypothetical protein